MSETWFETHHHPAPSDPAIDSALLPPGNTEAIPLFADPVWPLGALKGNPSAELQSIHWEKAPAVFRNELRYLAYLLINDVLPDTFLRDRHSTFRSRCGVAQTYRTVQIWLQLTTWLEQRGTSTLGECTEEIFRDYALHLARRRKLGRSSVCKHLVGLSRLWAFDALGNAPLGIAEPPWHREHIDEFLPGDPAGGGENVTEPISPATMGPLLVWALRVVEEFADDIIAAWGENRRLSAAAEQTPSTPESRRRLDAYLENLSANGLPLPSWQHGGRTFAAASYIAAHAGASNTQVWNAINTRGWKHYLKDHPGTCPLDVAITRKIESQPWCDVIDFMQAAGLMMQLVTACFVTLCYTTGMRPSEVLALRAGCCPDPPSGRHMIYGDVFKSARDEHGNHLPQGVPRDVPWVAIPPAVTAIRVLERIVGDGLLFDARRHDRANDRDFSGSLTVGTMRRRVDQFCAWATDLARQMGRAHEEIPADPHGQIGTTRFRRTLAWHIARQPGGLVALAIQYGHLRTAVSGSYASRSRDGIHELIDIETARATAETLSALHEALAAGAGISGPAARRAIAAATQAPTYIGAILTARQARQLLANPALAVYENPHAYLLCVYDPHKALCRRTTAQDTPQLDRCVAGCANICRTDRHAEHLLAQAVDLEKQAATELVPGPLAERLNSHSALLRGQADQHQRTRTEPGEPI